MTTGPPMLTDMLPLEARLVTACVAIPGGADATARALDLIAQNPDWDTVCSLAEMQGVMPLLHRFIASACGGKVSPAIVARLHAQFAGNALTHLRHARELVRIQSELREAGIAMLALKGPALAIQAYGDLALRPFGDLDILVHERDLPLVADILAARGYFPRRYQRDQPDGGYFQSSEDEFEARDGGDMVDVHWALVPSYFPYRPDYDELWRRAVTVTLDGGAIATLAPDDHLAFVIIHATKHGWPSLKPMCDVAAFAARGIVDWERVEAKLARLGCARMLNIGVLLAHELAGAAIPGDLIARARGDSHAAALAARVAARMFMRVADRPGLFHDWAVPLRAIEGFGRRARYVLVRGLKPTIDDWEFLPLPSALYPIYYAVRPVRLALQQGPRLLPRASRAAGLARS
jgi:Uncharacterised nucleotidyltransferase